MSRNHKTIIALTVLLFAIFPVMVLAGIGLTYESAVGTSTSQPRVISDTPEGNVAMDFVMAIPGISLIVAGYLGVFIMLIKVSTREIITDEGDQSAGKAGTITPASGTLPRPVYNENIIRIPLPVWWLVKNKGVFSKIE